MELRVKVLIKKVSDEVLYYFAECNQVYCIICGKDITKDDDIVEISTPFCSHLAHRECVEDMLRKGDINDWLS